MLRGKKKKKERRGLSEKYKLISIAGTQECMRAQEEIKMGRKRLYSRILECHDTECQFYSVGIDNH